MPTKISVRKASGELEAFSEEKLYYSLRHSGANDVLITWVMDQIRPKLTEGISTRRIYKEAFKLLRTKTGALAARYSLKQAIMELGPTGFPFEKFVGELLKRTGYNTLTGQIIQGRCVSHEVDVVAWNDNMQLMVECKYHNTPGNICSVQVPLYIQSRFLDVKSAWEQMPENKGKNYQGWVVTNTRFSNDASTFGRCAGLHLVGWDYPRVGSLKELVENTLIFPTTVLSGLNKKQKQILIENDIILCSDLEEQPSILQLLDLPDKSLRKIEREVKEILKIRL
ncbi:MAG: restriction endonuclease [Lentimicrobium sp.]|jgi:Holliday junction resolvase-like predicted endonuclease|nr:restriction endonuclease [Lentimicrobium sp.]